MPHRILILDDEPKMGALLTRSLNRDGYEAKAFESPPDALDALKGGGWDVLVTDLRMPGMDGLEVLQRAKTISPTTEIILMTAYATVETAREALIRGALDYLVKPVSAESDLKPLLARLFEGAEPREKAASGGGGARGDAATPDMIARSPAMEAIMRKIGKIAESNATVLLRGESGTGKEVMADTIQAQSQRSSAPYLKVNCGALTETLLESELFGHVRGAFTGAESAREGMFAAADGGTLLLDEIGEISAALQVKLLRILQSGEYQRVGESVTKSCDVRILAATNRNLEKMIETGEFRQDLYYRLNVVPIMLPPLQERREDLKALIDLFAGRFARGAKVKFSEEARRALMEYGWPGNIRELENAVEHALVFGEPDNIVIDDLPVAVQEARHKIAGAGSVPVGEATLEDIEKRCLTTALAKTGGNRTHAARLLGITRRTLGYRLRKYGLEEEVTQIPQQGTGEDVD